MALAAIVAASIVASPAARADTTGITRTDLQREDLSAPGREAIQVLVELAPGAAFPRHFHHGEELVYVEESFQLWRECSMGGPYVRLGEGRANARGRQADGSSAATC